MTSRPNELAPFHAPRRSILPTICRAAPILSVLAVAACSDAPTDLPGATPLECSGAIEKRTLRIDQLSIPITFDDADQLGIEQGDRDDLIDNQAGSTLALLFQTYPELKLEQPDRIRRRIDSDTIWLIEVERCDGEARVSLARGELDGTQLRVVERGALPAAGTSEAGRVEVVDGIALLPLSAIADIADVGFDDWAATYPTQIRIDLGSTEASGRITGSLSPGYVAIVARAFLPYIQGRLDAGLSDYWSETLDPDADGVVTFDELSADPYFLVMVSPDQDVGGDVLAPPAIPPLDGELESYSFGFGFHAVDVEVE